MKDLKSRPMKFLFILSVSLIVFLASCSKHRKVIIMASGKIEVTGNTINLNPGTTHNELTMDAEDKINVTSPAGNKEFPLNEEGLYLLNLKNDTLVGSYQRTGTDNSQIVISQEDLFTRVDSLNKLIRGQNVSEAARNYNVPPLTIAKITKNTDAQVIGPYRKLPASFDPSREHEVYKFYTTKEVVEIIEKVNKMLKNQ
jgi:hypothetical protein